MISVCHDKPTKTFALASVAALLLAPAPLAAQDFRAADVLGSITAEIGGERLEWQTVTKNMDGEEEASAVWSTYAPPDVLGNLGEEQRAMMQAQMERLKEMGIGDDALAAMMGGGAADGGIDLRITGLDPESERMLIEGALTIEAGQLPADDMDAFLSTSHEADISYFRNRGPDTGLHVSSHSIGTGATVTFDRLDVGAGDGRAEGRFAATLCPISTLMGGNPDPETCVPISGEFATDLRAKTTDGDGS